MNFSAFFTIKKGAQILEFYTEKVNKRRKIFFANKSKNDISKILWSFQTFWFSQRRKNVNEEQTSKHYKPDRLSELELRDLENLKQPATLLIKNMRTIYIISFFFR